MEMTSEDILWMLIYSVLGLAIIYFAFRVRRLRAELRELKEESARDTEEQASPEEGGEEKEEDQ